MLDKKLKKRAVHRAKIIHGQMSGLIRAIEQEQYCPRLLEQSLAIQKSLKSLDGFLMENHLRSHIKHQFLSGKDREVIKELMEIYLLNNK